MLLVLTQEKLWGNAASADTWITLFWGNAVSADIWITVFGAMLLVLTHE